MKDIKKMTKSEFCSYLEHTVIGPTVGSGELEKFCREAVENHFAVVYVNGCDVAQAKKLLAGTPVHVGVPIGYPLGVSSIATKIAEGLNAIESGGDDLDVVINVSMVKRKNYEYVQEELHAFVQKMQEKKPDIVVKVIIEAPLLTREEKIHVCEIVASCGADYIKQSTGFCYGYSYSLGDIELMKNIVGERVKVKASGYFSSVEDVMNAIAYGAERVGTDSAIKWLTEFDNNIYAQL